MFTTSPISSHGQPQERLSSAEQVLGRSAAVQVQVVLAEEEMAGLLEVVRGEFRGTGLRYWATPVALEGEA
jgi:hypothetical protein